MLKFKLKREATEIETILADRHILEQGTVRFNGKIFMTNLILRRITSNVENMNKLIYRRENKYTRQPSLLLEQSGSGETKLHAYALMDKRIKELRFESRLCTLVSENVQVLSNDIQAMDSMDGNEIVECRLEMQEKERTQYETYLEIQVYSKLSTTTWDDNVIVSWETVIRFFAFFGYAFDPVRFFKNGKFSMEESMLFYRFLPECLTFDQETGSELVFNIDLLNDEKVKFDQIYLNYRRLKWTKDHHELPFYFTDILARTKFEPGSFDFLEFPFFQEPVVS